MGKLEIVFNGIIGILIKSFDLNDLLTLWLSHYNKKYFRIQWKPKTIAKCCCAGGDLDGSDSNPLYTLHIQLSSNIPSSKFWQYACDFSKHVLVILQQIQTYNAFFAFLKTLPWRRGYYLPFLLLPLLLVFILMEMTYSVIRGRFFINNINHRHDFVCCCSKQPASNDFKNLRNMSNLTDHSVITRRAMEKYIDLIACS